MADGKMMKRFPHISQEITKLYKPAVCINKHTGNKLLRDVHIQFPLSSVGNCTCAVKGRS